MARLAAQQDGEPSQELGDFIEPGSFSGPIGSAGDAGGLEQLQELRAAGLIDAKTLEMIEATMQNPTAELDRLHASGVMSDEVYAQAKATLSATGSASGASVDAAELDLLQRGDSATATVLALSQAGDEANARRVATLQVHPAAGPAYEAECSLLAVHPGAELKPGDFLPVKVDPEDPKHVAVDWTAFGT